MWKYFILASILNYPFKVSDLCGNDLVRFKDVDIVANMIDIQERECMLTNKNIWVKGYKIKRDILMEKYRPIEDSSLPKR